MCESVRVFVCESCVCVAVQMLAGQEEKARRAAERARMREEKRKQAGDDLEAKRTSLLSTIKEKVGAHTLVCVHVCPCVCVCVCDEMRACVSVCM